MAAKVMIAIRQAEALSRVQVAAAMLSARFALPAVELAPQQRDPDLARALQIEAVAVLLEGLVAQTLPGPAPVAEPVKVKKQGGAG